MSLRRYMCLIVVTSKENAENFTFTDGQDWCSYNQDGAGIMYFKEGKLVVRKVLPCLTSQYDPLAKGRHADATYGSTVWGLWREAVANADEGSEFAIHLRMRTHGDIDHENTHPYSGTGYASESFGDAGFHLMHNGILRHGNKADTSKSDTWHYLRRLESILNAGEIGLLVDPEFQRLVENDIGDNRFVFAFDEDDQCRMTIYNRGQGVEHKGAWFSNTYAWSAPFRQFSKYSWADYVDLGSDDDMADVSLEDMEIEDAADLIMEAAEASVAANGIHGYEPLVLQFMQAYEEDDYDSMQVILYQNVEYFDQFVRG